MKKFKKLWPLFLTKEKVMITFIVFILLNITIFIAFQGSIYSHDGYKDIYPQTGLEFFYYLHTIGITPFLFIIMMLLMPNIISYDVLNLQQTHASYMIETRLSKKSYYQKIFIQNIIFSTLIVIVIEILILGLIHIFYAPIHFNIVEYPELYYCKTQLLFHNEILSWISFVVLTGCGYGLISSLLFSLQVIISNKYIYRCFGVIFGILLVLFPALIQGFIPINDAAFILQINNLVALGMENVRANPLGLSHFALYLICFVIYAGISYIAYQTLLKWRKCYD
ncbi:MAG: hypothetical protein ACLUVC_01715 [Longibaculum sp.]